MKQSAGERLRGMYAARPCENLGQQPENNFVFVCRIAFCGVAWTAITPPPKKNVPFLQTRHSAKFPCKRCFGRLLSCRRVLLEAGLIVK